MKLMQLEVRRGRKKVWEAAASGGGHRCVHALLGWGSWRGQWERSSVRVTSCPGLLGTQVSWNVGVSVFKLGQSWANQV